MNAFSLVLLIAVCMPLGAWAGDIYRWRDDAGKTHMSDRVPPEYRNKATKIDGQKYQAPPSPARQPGETSGHGRDHGQRKAQQDLETARELVSPGAPASSPAWPDPRPTAGVCAEMWRLYDESEACFGPFRMGLGRIRPEAFDRCTERKDPSRLCGPRSHR